VWPLVESWDMP
jgi:hypothetical protein